MLRKITGLIVIYITCINIAYSQGLSFGIKAGTDVHKIDSRSFTDQFTFGYHAGVFAEIRLNSKLSIQPEIYFSQISVDTGKNFSEIYDFNKVHSLKFGYINIPLLLNIKPMPQLTIQLGPQYGLIVNNNLSLIQNGKDALKNGDFSVAGGVQVNISRVRIYARYLLGLSELNDIDDKDSWKSQTIHAGLALKF